MASNPTAALGYDSDGHTIQSYEYAYRRSPDQDAKTPPRHPVIVVGAGPVGLSLAIDLAQRGQRVLLLDNDSKLSTGSRAICFAKRTLEVWDRLGVGDAMCAKGVDWNVGKVFFHDDLLYRFDLLPDPGHERPAFINLQQYYAEAFLAVRAAELPKLQIRWHNNVVALEQSSDGVALGIDTPEGRYRVAADYVVACDGSRSPLRALLGQESKGRLFRDRFLIADVKFGPSAAPGRSQAGERPLGGQRSGEAASVGVVPSPAPGRSQAGERPLGGQRSGEAASVGVVPSAAPGRSQAGERPLGGQRSGEAASVGVVNFPAERWFWFDPPFHRNQSVLLHRQPDGVWRIDFQLGWDANPDEEKKPEAIRPRVDAMLRQALGREVPYELEWASVYTFACLRMDAFRHGRVLFAGDSAHGVSPFGARGANSGVQDAENLAWKLVAVLQGQAGDALLDSYAAEREYAADENILNSTRATDFITPKSEISRLFRDAVLQLSKQHAFARTLVNSGRLSVPATLHGSALNTPDTDSFAGRMMPGAPAADAPVRLSDGSRGWLLRQLAQGFTVLLGADARSAALAEELRAATRGLAALDVLVVAPPAGERDAALFDVDGLVAQRYDLQPGNAVLLRPDQHVCARWRRPSAAGVRGAVLRALAKTEPRA